MLVVFLTEGRRKKERARKNKKDRVRRVGEGGNGKESGNGWEYQVLLGVLGVLPVKSAGKNTQVLARNRLDRVQSCDCAEKDKRVLAGCVVVGRVVGGGVDVER